MIKTAMRICFALAALLVALLIGLIVPIPALAGDDKARLCLAEAMYYEARDQGWRGMMAVGVVIQNRVEDSRHKCQFSYYCDGKPERPAEKEAWTTAQGLAELLLATEVEVVGLEDATHYHAVWVQPSWTTALQRKTKIGGHIFYAQR